MKTVASIPVVSGLPVFGNLFDFRNDRLELQRRVFRECGDIGLFRMGPTAPVMVTRADLAYEVMVEQDTAFVESLAALLHLPLSWPTPRNMRMRRAISRLDQIVYRIIRERRESGKDTGDVLSMLLLARDEDDGSGMSDLMVRDEALTLMLAGHE